ncbi:MAG: hypothetical protein M1827_006208 [Pycnora praestabilis]|nr:MAG: hypothetical protein M1827_006208 [Pycnora praestabilis]
MALTASAMGMDLADKTALHPFFDKIKLSRQPSSHITPLPDRAPTPPPTVNEDQLLRTEVQTKPKRPQRSALDNEKKKKKQRNAKKTRAINEEEGPRSVSHADRPQRKKEPRLGEEVPQSRPGSDVELSATLDADPNDARRKRRKTNSPKSSTISKEDRHSVPLATMVDSLQTEPKLPSWQSQLDIAAYADHPASPRKVLIEASSPRSSIPTYVAVFGEGLPATPPSEIETPTKILDSSRTATPCPADQHPHLIEEPTDIVLKHGVSSPKKAGPKKKMLRLNAKGKLSSPISKNSIEEKPSENKEPPKSRRTKSLQRQLLAVIKYGHDTQSKHMLGERIEDIMRRTQQHQIARVGVAAKLAEPLEPPKQTHPFFLQKDGHKSNMDQGNYLNDSSNVPADTAKDPENESKAMISPRKPRDLKNVIPESKRSTGFAAFGKGATSPRKIKLSKYPGAIEPAWPWQGMVHVRGKLDDGVLKFKALTRDAHEEGSELMRSTKKLKNTIVQVSEDEDELLLLASRLQLEYKRGIGLLKGFESDTKRPDVLRLPERKLISGCTLQTLVRGELRSRLPRIRNTERNDSSEDDLSLPLVTRSKTHPALVSMWDGIATDLSPFDKAECETHLWVQKYAPKTAEEVLQSGREAILLRDWLRNLKVLSVDTGLPTSTKGQDTATISKKSSRTKLETAKPRRKRQRRYEELNDFIISSEEEADEMDEITDSEDGSFIRGSNQTPKKTVVRSGDVAAPSQNSNRPQKLTNAVVVSGPHGCGKTAAVYAVAKELDFEVFEINAGSRRNGKDILDKVGDMTKNHLVQHARKDRNDVSADEDVLRVTEALKNDIESGRQGTMNSFFKPKKRIKKSQKPKSKPGCGQLEVKTKEVPKIKPQIQKQSLILLEEVDVLFEEDKQFWLTVFTLIARSKRPVILTCNDEALVPMQCLSLHAVLRFSPPPEQLAVDHLLLLGAREGHLIRRNAVSSLYKSKRQDLRASIMELDLWCQMALGDRKGGLEWMYQRPSHGKDVDERGETLRVTSRDTYKSGIGWLSRDNMHDRTEDSYEEELLLEAWDGWQVDVEDWHEHNNLSLWANDVSEDTEGSKIKRLKILQSFETFTEALSAADIHSGMGLRTGNMAILDTTQPAKLDKRHSEYIDGQTLLQAEPMVDFSHLSTRLAITVKHIAKTFLRRATLHLNTNTTQSLRPLREDDMIKTITHLGGQARLDRFLTRGDLSAAFDPIAEPPKVILAHSSGLQPSAFDRPISPIVVDLAPYIRSIVSYDLRLREQRIRLSNLLSESGRNGKSIRTTRASRSALEGGKRSSTRREKWFPNGMDANLVFKTGGTGWQDAVLELEKGASEVEQRDDDELSQRRSSDATLDEMSG